MIFEVLSNAAYRVSLPGPGAELDGALRSPPTISGGKSRGPAGRALSLKRKYNPIYSILVASTSLTTDAGVDPETYTQHIPTCSIT